MLKKRLSFLVVSRAGRALFRKSQTVGQTVGQIELHTWGGLCSDAHVPSRLPGDCDLLRILTEDCAKPALRGSPPCGWCDVRAAAQAGWTHLLSPRVESLQGTGPSPTLGDTEVCRRGALGPPVTVDVLLCPTAMGRVPANP